MSEAQAVIQETVSPAAAPAEKPVEATPAPEDIVSPKLGLIARKERALVQKQQEFQRQMQEWEKHKTELQSRLEAMEKKERLWKETPEKALEEYGHNYQTLTERVLSGGDLTPKDIEKKMNERFEQLQRAQEEEKKKQQEAAQKAQEEQEQLVISQYKDDLKGFIVSKKDEFKLTALFDAEADLVYDTVDAYFQEHQKILSHEEAAQLVEKYFRKLVDDANGALTPKQQEAAEKALDMDTVAQVKVNTGAEQAVRKPSSTTLTNNMNATTPTKAPVKNEDDRIKRALAALERGYAQ